MMPPTEPLVPYYSSILLALTIFSNGSSFNHSHINPVVILLIFRIETVHQVLRKHAQMLIEEVDIAVVDSFCDFLSNLMRSSPLNHVEFCPSVLRFCSGRSTDEKVVLELSLQVVLLYVVCKSSRYFPSDIFNFTLLKSNLYRALTWDILHQ